MAGSVVAGSVGGGSVGGGGIAVGSVGAGSVTAGSVGGGDSMIVGGSVATGARRGGAVVTGALDAGTAGNVVDAGDCVDAVVSKGDVVIGAETVGLGIVVDTVEEVEASVAGGSCSPIQPSAAGIVVA